MSCLLSKTVDRSAKQALGVLLGAYREALEGCGEPLEGSGAALGRLLGGSWEALGRLLEASKRHLGPKTVIARIFRRFLKKKNGKFGEPSWQRFNIQNRICWGSKRVSKIIPILKAFWHRFLDDF